MTSPKRTPQELLSSWVVARSSAAAADWFLGQIERLKSSPTEKDIYLALGYATRYARGLEDDPERSDRFVGMYVNDWTRDYGDAGRWAVQLLLDRGFEAGILPRHVEAEFVES